MKRVLVWTGWCGWWLALMTFYVIASASFIRSAHAHEWFTGATNPVTNARCCDGTDCAVLTGNDDWWEEAGVIYVRWKNGTVYAIAANEAAPSQDKEGRAAACVWAGKLRCFFMPVNF